MGLCGVLTVVGRPHMGRDLCGAGAWCWELCEGWLDGFELLPACPPCARVCRVRHSEFPGSAKREGHTHVVPHGHSQDMFDMLPLNALFRMSGCAADTAAGGHEAWHAGVYPGKDTSQSLPLLITYGVPAVACALPLPVHALCVSLLGRRGAPK